MVSGGWRQAGIEVAIKAVQCLAINVSAEMRIAFPKQKPLAQNAGGFFFLVAGEISVSAAAASRPVPAGRFRRAAWLQGWGLRRGCRRW